MKQNLTPINYNLIPAYVTRVTETLEKAGFEAFIVGGCVRDLLLGRTPKDWDVTTNANPEQIQALFEKTVYENKYGTVAVFIPKNVTRVTSEGVSRLPANASDIESTDIGEVSRETTSGSKNNQNKAKQAGETTTETVSRMPSPEGGANGGQAYETAEVTPYRLESEYKDNRHPDTVTFSQNIEDDLKRRDFTVNAMAFAISSGKLIDQYTRPTERSQSFGREGQVIDLFGGLNDLRDMSLRTVGAPRDRFGEDALRMLRAVRFAAELGFTVSHETMEAIIADAHLLKNISAERIRDELVKIVMSPDPVLGIGMLQKFGLLKYIIPELEEGIGCEQKGEHIYDVFEHILHAFGHAGEKKWPLEIRLAALFHDIGKPRTRRWDGTKAGGKGKYTFYGHEVIGARMTAKIMERLKFPKDTAELVVKLVRYHMFFSDTEMITLSAVRRTIVNVGREHIWELMEVRECDRVGMKKKEAPYRLRKYHAMIEEALRSPTSVGMLKIDGSRIMELMDERPGPKVGFILHALLEEALENPDLNNEQYLEKRTLELAELPLEELKKLAEKGKQAKAETEEAELEEIRKKHGVK